MLKYSLFLLLPVLLASCSASLAKEQEQEEEIEYKEIPVLFKVGDTSFPEEWKTDEIDARGEDLEEEEEKRSEKIVRKALAKYPEDLLAENLREVYVLHSIQFFGVEYGGTNSSDAVYLSNKGKENGYDNLYLEKTFHHEFSSILLRNYPDLIDQESWEALNDFDYFDESGGVNSIKNETDGLDYNPAYLEAGFLYQYGASCFENDLNSFAENILCPTEEYLGFLEKYPKIRKKQDLFVAFYGAINTYFDAAYFDGLEMEE